MINTFLRRAAEDVPMMTAERFAWMMGPASEKDVQAAEHPYFKQAREVLKPQLQILGDIAIAPIEGTLAYNPDVFEMVYMGVEDSRSVLAMLKTAESNPNVEGVLLRMDTPGGMMMGGPEISDQVEKLIAMGKPVVTHVGGLGASLGYLIAAPSSKIIANKSAMVGSIGVISTIPDYTKYLENLGIKIEVFTNKDAKFKAAGAVGTSLTDAQRGYIQARVESAFALFRDTVTAHRPKVKAEAMQGQVLRGDEAIKAGLVDATGGEDFAIGVLRQEMKKRRSA